VPQRHCRFFERRIVHAHLDAGELRQLSFYTLSQAAVRQSGNAQCARIRCIPDDRLSLRQCRSGIGIHEAPGLSQGHLSPFALQLGLIGIAAIIHASIIPVQ
jgi:hypothetical protein